MSTFGAVVLVIVLGGLILGIDAWVIQMNVNDISSYYRQGEAAPFWPFFWILLFAGGTLGGAASSSRS